MTAFTASKPTAFPDIAGIEQEQDPNTALLELDRGLKSTNIGEQCEAISRFPGLFEKYPFPILINSALLKLADVFRQEIPGINFVRVCVADVIESSGKHLEKLISIEEFLRRIATVMHSNDPMARALTLRTLAWMSEVVGENKQVHHLIRDALDSKDSVEVQAAIVAMEKYTAKSKTFAISMCQKLTAMISGLATPIEVKLQLIRIFHHMHHDIETASTVRNHCLKLLKENPTQRVTITTLHSLTQLAAHSLVDIEQQVDLLIDFLNSEPRESIREAVLEELDYLAVTAPHAWATQNLQKLVEYCKESLNNTEISFTSLSILSALLVSDSFSPTESIENSLLDLCLRSVNMIDTKVACKGLQLYANLAIHKQGTHNDSSMCEDALDASVILIQFILEDPKISKMFPHLQCCLIAAVELVKNNDCDVSYLLETIFYSLSNHDLPERIKLLICESLACLGGNRTSVISSKMPQLLQLITQVTSDPSPSKGQYEMMNILITLVLQTYHGKEWSSHSQSVLLSASQSVNAWLAYRMAREASRYGHHKIAYNLYKSLCSRISSDQLHFWMVALSEMSKGEDLAIETGERADNLSAANSFLHRALTSMKAASCPGQPLEFCQQYLAMRAETMICHAQLLHACLSLRTAPPPAIAAPMVASSSRHEDLARCGRVVQQLTKSSADFYNLAVRYGTLYQSSFDADPHSLCNLALLKEGSNVMAQAIELIIKTTSISPQEFVQCDLSLITERLGGKTVESSSLVKAIENAVLLAHDLAEVCTEMKPVREQHLNLIQEISKMLTAAVPMPYPRFFFQRLQQTSITLNLSPQPRSPGDAVSVQTSEFLGVKVEGVIVHSKRKACFRSVQSVTLKLSSVLQNRSSQHSLDVKQVETNDTMSQTVHAHNDFFSTQFMPGFPVAGMYQVTIEASVTDTEDNNWKTGPTLNLSVKAQEVGPALRPPLNTYNSAPQGIGQQLTFAVKSAMSEHFVASTSQQTSNNYSRPL